MMMSEFDTEASHIPKGRGVFSFSIFSREKTAGQFSSIFKSKNFVKTLGANYQINVSCDFTNFLNPKFQQTIVKTNGKKKKYEIVFSRIFQRMKFLKSRETKTSDNFRTFQ